MSGIRIQRLKARALQFLENARLNVEKGYYDLAVFNCEQSLQLYLKAILQELFASEFRSHELRSLLSHLSKLLGESGFQEAQREIDALTRSKRDFLIDLENAYIDSRYGDVEYDRSHAEEILKSTEETINKPEVIARNVKLGKG